MKEIQEIKNYLRREGENLRSWTKRRSMQLALFNFFLVFLVLLRSAGYFDPFFPITINLIVFLSMIFATALLHFRSKQLFVLSFLFWLIAAFFRIGGIEVWAERTAIYTFQALFLGVILLIIENVRSKEGSRSK